MSDTLTNKIFIRTRCGDFNAELDDSDISDVIWLLGSFSIKINMFGGMMYGELPSDKIPVKDNTSELEIGDIAYWSVPNALCIFFGPTPLSSDNKRPIVPFLVTRIGRIIGDCSELRHVGDRQNISIFSIF